MKTSRYFIPTLKETPSEAEIVSHRLMLRAGMIRQLASGVYTWLPLGLRILEKVKGIVREEMDRIGAFEILMPAIQPAALWKESGRWDEYGDEMLRLKDRHGREFCYGPTHEEIVTDLLRHELRSYKQLPFICYQIQTKFRDEVRPRFGVMRGREFVMKDAYSFDLDKAGLEASYQTMYDAYVRIFTRLGLNFRAVLADNANMGGDCSQEFHVLADTGEDILAISDGSDYAANIEVANLKEGDPSPDGKGRIYFKRGIEVGHIFQQNDKYTKPMKANVLNEQGKGVTMQMGAYGIGVSRIVGAAIEQSHDERGIIWPEAMAPFQLAIVPINYHKSYRVKEASEKLYEQCQTAGIEVLLEDRNERPGILFSTMDLLGIPHRLVINERHLDEGCIEYKFRKEDEVITWPLEGAIERLVTLLRGN